MSVADLFPTRFEENIARNPRTMGLMDRALARRRGLDEYAKTALAAGPTPEPPTSCQFSSGSRLWEAPTESVKNRPRGKTNAGAAGLNGASTNP